MKVLIHFFIEIQLFDTQNTFDLIVRGLKYAFSCPHRAAANSKEELEQYQTSTEKEPKRNFLYFTDVSLVVVDIKSERFIKMDTLDALGLL